MTEYLTFAIELGPEDAEGRRSVCMRTEDRLTGIHGALPPGGNIDQWIRGAMIVFYPGWQFDGVGWRKPGMRAEDVI